MSAQLFPLPSPTERGPALDEFLGRLADGIAQAMEAFKGELDMGITTPLPEPYDSIFGEMTVAKHFFRGCRPEGILNNPGSQLVMLTADEQGERVIEIGSTPKRRPQRYGQNRIPDAGEPGELLLVSYSLDDALPEVRFRYLDRSELSGAVVKKGERFALKISRARIRQLVGGEVQEVFELRSES